MTDAEKHQIGAAGGSSGIPPIDPSENVKALTEAAVKRLDDLRIANNEYIKARLDHGKEMADLREHCAQEKDALRASYLEKLAEKESARLDAIRAVDQLAVSTAAARSDTAIQTLAVNQAKDTETLRLAVADTATTLATQNAAQNAEYSRKIAAVEQSQYESKGKAGMSDPMMAELSQDMKAVIQALAKGTGKGEGISLSWAILVAVVVIIIAYMSMKPNNVPAAPQPIYITPTPTATK